MPMLDSTNFNDRLYGVRYEALFMSRMMKAVNDSLGRRLPAIGNLWLQGHTGYCQLSSRQCLHVSNCPVAIAQDVDSLPGSKIQESKHMAAGDGGNKCFLRIDCVFARIRQGNNGR